MLTGNVDSGDWWKDGAGFQALPLCEHPSIQVKNMDQATRLKDVVLSKEIISILDGDQIHHRSLGQVGG